MVIYSEKCDNDLLHLAQEGDKQAEEQLALRYSRLVKICSRPFFLAGGDGEDLIQEGMFGLLSAIREFDDSMNTSFKTYAEICVKRRIYSAIKTATRKKHDPLNDMVSFDDVLSDESQANAVSSYSEVFRRTPEEQVLARESADEIFQTYSRCLSKFEADILRLPTPKLQRLAESPKSLWTTPYSASGENWRETLTSATSAMADAI